MTAEKGLRLSVWKFPTPRGMNDTIPDDAMRDDVMHDNAMHDAVMTR